MMPAGMPSVGRGVLDGVDEEVRAHAHHGDRAHELRGHGPGRRRGARGPEGQVRRGVLLQIPGRLHGPNHVDHVRDEQQDCDQDLQDQGQGHDPRPGGQSEAGKKEREVRDGGFAVGRDLVPRLPATPVTERRNPDDEQRERREQERGAEDRADADFARRGTTRAHDQSPEDGDYGDHGLRQRRPDGRQDTAHRARAEVHPLAKDLDRVGEQDRRPKDRAKGEDHFQNRHRRPFVALACSEPAP